MTKKNHCKTMNHTNRVTPARQQRVVDTACGLVHQVEITTSRTLGNFNLTFELHPYSTDDPKLKGADTYSFDSLVEEFKAACSSCRVLSETPREPKHTTITYDTSNPEQLVEILRKAEFLSEIAKTDLLKAITAVKGAHSPARTK